jgi:hypothetical protein
LAASISLKSWRPSTSNFNGAVGRASVHYHQLVSDGLNGLEAFFDEPFFVFGDHAHGKAEGRFTGDFRKNEPGRAGRAFEAAVQELTDGFPARREAMGMLSTQASTLTVPN